MFIFSIYKPAEFWLKFKIIKVKKLFKFWKKKAKNWFNVIIILLLKKKY